MSFFFFGWGQTQMKSSLPRKWKRHTQTKTKSNEKRGNYIRFYLYNVRSLNYFLHKKESCILMNFFVFIFIIAKWRHYIKATIYTSMKSHMDNINIKFRWCVIFFIFCFNLLGSTHFLAVICLYTDNRTSWKITQKENTFKRLWPKRWLELLKIW